MMQCYVPQAQFAVIFLCQVLQRGTVSAVEFCDLFFEVVHFLIYTRVRVELKWAGLTVKISKGARQKVKITGYSYSWVT